MGPFTRATVARLSFLTAAAVVASACGDSGATGATDGSGAGSSTSGPGAGGASTSGSGGSGSSTGVGGGAPIDCAPLAPATGTVVSVDPSQAGALAQMVFDAAPGTTFALAAGTYGLTATLQVRADGVTLRSQNDDATSVILDGGYTVNELIQITASDVTIAHVELTRSVDHLVHAFPPAAGQDVTGLRLYGVRMVDGGEQFLKVNPIAGQDGWVDDGRVECSTFLMTSAGRPHVESCCGGCYTGGIDVHSAWGWVVSGNRFEGIYCDGAGLAEHAVHFWKGSRDTLVERNEIVDCARGIGFGLGGGSGERVYPDAPQGGANLAHYDGIIRNNTILARIPYYDTGIEIDEAAEPVVAFNTVIATAGATNAFSSIDYRFASTSCVIQDNLVDNITQRDGAAGQVSNNLEATPLSYFADAAGGDLHLVDGASGAIGQGVPRPDAGLDIDGEPRDAAAPDLGADEH